MKKRMILFAFVVLAFSSLQAQSNVGFSGGIRLALPVGDFEDFYSFGVGAEFQGEASVASNVTIPFSAGYTRFFGKEFFGTRVDGVGLIPILAGVHVYPTPQFFIGGKIGYGILTGDGDSEGAFNYEPRLGYNSSKVQIALGYNGWTKDGETLGHIALVTMFKF